MASRPAFRLSAQLGLIFLCALAGCGDGTKPAPAAGQVQKPSYDRERVTLSEAIDGGRKLIERQPENSLLALETVSLYVERARLTGNFDDYRDAGALLETTTARMDQRSFPCLAHARLDYTLHRMQAASAALDACPPSVARDEVAGLRADIAFYSGRYAEAEAIYRELVNQVGTPQQYIRLALFRSKMGSPGEAAALLEAAEKRYHGVSATMKAWLKVRRGALAFERGRIDEALALYAIASDELPGWWMIDEHIAEAKRISGDTAGATALYADLAKRTGLPEHMDELARLLREGNTPEAANEWVQRAERLYRERLETFPEASAGHAVEHFLQFGAPAEALALARRSAAARGDGDTQVALCAALYRAGRAGEAGACITRVQESGFDTPQLHAMAATIFASLGRNAEADAARAKALARNRYAMRLYPVTPPVQSEMVSML